MDRRSQAQRHLDEMTSPTVRRPAAPRQRRPGLLRRDEVRLRRFYRVWLQDDGSPTSSRAVLRDMTDGDVY